MITHLTYAQIVDKYHFDKHIWEGWEVRDFITKLEPTIETWSDPSCMSNVILVFNEVKKDGTPSKRTRNIFYSVIEDITKVTE